MSFARYFDRLETLAQQAREKRARLFRETFNLGPDTLVLDLGTEYGHYVARVTSNTALTLSNIFAADIIPASIAYANETYGFTPVLLQESDALPFSDNSFDIVFCNSVIEHVTVPKDEVWQIKSGKLFRERSLKRQRMFADEIRRVGKGFWVQTPNRWFPMEPHTRLPFAGWLPRRILLAMMKFTNPDGVPDWSWLGKTKMQELFPGCEILTERVMGMAKSFVAVKKPAD